MYIEITLMPTDDNKFASHKFQVLTLPTEMNANANSDQVIQLWA